MPSAVACVRRARHGHGLAFYMQEAQELAQQHSQRGNYQLYWRLNAVPVGSKPRRHEAQMAGYLLATRAAQLFPG